MLIVAFGALGCGRDEDVQESRIVGDTLTVYSSLPQEGPLARVSVDLIRAEKLALKEAGGRAGGWNVSYVSLDSADPDTGRSDPGIVAGNARRAVQALNTVAYLGELEPGTSAVSLPILNAGGVLQVTPRDTYAGFTEPAGPGEPDRWFPSGVMNLVRMVPPDAGEGEKLVRLMDAHGVRRLVVADDRGLAGVRLAERVAGLARDAGIEVVRRESLDATGEVTPEVVDRLTGDRADGLLYAGVYGDFAVELLRDVHAASPRLPLYGGDALSLGPDLAERVGAAGRRLFVVEIEPITGGGTAAFERRFAAEYGELPDALAVLGYASMQLVLEAIERAGEEASSRRAVMRHAAEFGRAPRARARLHRIRR